MINMESARLVTIANYPNWSTELVRTYLETNTRIIVIKQKIDCCVYYSVYI
jgi:hypothetical protein